MATVTQTGAQGASWDLNLYNNEPMPWEQPQDGNLLPDNQGWPNSALANGSFGSAYEMSLAPAGNSASAFDPGDARLEAGESLGADESIWTADQRYRLIMQNDGNLVVYRAADNAVMWNTSTWGHPGARAVMQADGNLALYDAQNQAYWTSATQVAGGALTLQADGSLTVSSLGGSATIYAPEDAVLGSGEFLVADQAMWTADRRYRLIMQNDGNLVLYRAADNAAMWNTGTWSHPGARAVMQIDGNLVIYNTANQAVWTSGTQGAGAALRLQADGSLTVNGAGVNATVYTPSDATLGAGEFMLPGQSITTANGRYRLSMQDDGNLVVYQMGANAAMVAVWNSGTWGHPGARAVMQTDGNFVIYDAQYQALWLSNSTVAGSVLNLQADGGLTVSGAGASTEVYVPQTRPVQLEGAPRARSTMEWDRVRAMWAASQGEPYRVYQQMIENGWDVADVAFATGQSVQVVGAYLTRAGAQAGFGGAATLGRDAVDAPFLAAVNAEVGRFGHFTEAEAQSGTPGWVVITGRDESGLPELTYQLDLRAFAKWYMAQPQGQDFARVHGGVVEEGSTEQSVLLQSGARMVVGLDDNLRYVPAEMVWNLDLRFVENPGNVVIYSNSRGTVPTGNTTLVLSGSADPVTQVALWMMVAKPENQELVQAFGKGGVSLPSNQLSEQMRQRFGTELATALYRLSEAASAMRQRYVDELIYAMRHTPLLEDGSARPGWIVSTLPGVDESGQPLLSMYFDAQAHYKWYVSQPQATNRLLGAICGTEAEALKPESGMQGFRTKGTLDGLTIETQYATLDTGMTNPNPTMARDWSSPAQGASALDLDRPERLRDPNLVEYTPLYGFITPDENVIQEGPDDYERFVVMLTVITFSFVGAKLGAQMTELWKISSVAGAAATSSAMAGAIGTAVSGAINGNLHFKDVLKGALSGALTAGIMQSLPVSGASAIAARTGIQGLVQAALGGSFKDGSLAGFATGLAAEIGKAIEGGIDQAVREGSLSVEAGRAGRYISNMFSAATRIILSGADTPGYDFASSFLDATLSELNLRNPPASAPAPAPVMDPGSLAGGGGLGGVVGNAPLPAPAPPPDWAGGGVIGAIGNMPAAPVPAPAPASPVSPWGSSIFVPYNGQMIEMSWDSATGTWLEAGQETFGSWLDAPIWLNLPGNEWDGMLLQQGLRLNAALEDGIDSIDAADAVLPGDEPLTLEDASYSIPSAKKAIQDIADKAMEAGIEQEQKLNAITRGRPFQSPFGSDLPSPSVIGGVVAGILDTAVPLGEAADIKTELESAMRAALRGDAGEAQRILRDCGDRVSNEAMRAIEGLVNTVSNPGPLMQRLQQLMNDAAINDPVAKAQLARMAVPIYLAVVTAPLGLEDMAGAIDALVAQLGKIEGLSTTQVARIRNLLPDIAIDAGAGTRNNVIIGPWREGAANIVPNGTFTQCADGSCVSAAGQILSGGTLTEQQLLSKLGEWSNPNALAAELNRANPTANWQSGYFASEIDALNVANRGQVGVVLQAPGAPAHMVVMEPIAGRPGMYRVYDTGAGATYDVTAAWIRRFVAGGVWR